MFFYIIDFLRGVEMEMKKGLLIVLFIRLGAAVFAQTKADFTVQANNNGTLTITKFEGWDKDIKIPSTL